MRHRSSATHVLTPVMYAILHACLPVCLSVCLPACLSSRCLFRSIGCDGESTPCKQTLQDANNRRRPVPPTPPSTFSGGAPFPPRLYELRPQSFPFPLRPFLCGCKPRTIRDQALERRRVVGVSSFRTGDVSKMRRGGCRCGGGDAAVPAPPFFFPQRREALKEEVLPEAGLRVQRGLEPVPPQHAPAAVDVADGHRPRSLPQTAGNESKETWHNERRRVRRPSQRDGVERRGPMGALKHALARRCHQLSGRKDRRLEDY